MGIVGAMNGAGGDVCHLAGGEDAFFLPHPLFGPAIEDINDFLPVRVVVERVAVTRGHVCADEEELFRCDKVRAAEPANPRAGGDLRQYNADNAARGPRLRADAGTVLDDQLTIACGSGAIRPTLVQRAGRPAMATADMLRGWAIRPGDFVQ